MNNIWDKLTKALVVLLVLAGVLAVCVWYLPLIRQNERLRTENLRLETQIQKEEESNKVLRLTLEATHNDPKTVERLARSYLGYAKTNEVVVRFEPPVSVTPPRR